MSCSRWAAAGASMFALVLSPGAALAAGARSAARSPSAHAKQGAHSQRRPEAFASRRQRVAARAHAGRHAVELLAPGSGSQQATGSGRVRVLQRRLAGSGFAPGPIDGRYGPLTTRAVIRFQAAQRLRVDGIAGPETLTQLRVTARTAARDQRVQLRPAAFRRARSPRRPVDVRPSTSPRLPRTAPDPVVPKSLSSRAVTTVPASGGLSIFWLLLAGLTAAGGGLVGVAVSRRSRALPRRRRYISSRTMVIARRSGFRYSRHRQAYVLRLVGNRFGPVLKTTPSGIRQPSPRRHFPVHHNRRRAQRQVRS